MLLSLADHLHFLSELKSAFIRTLNLDDEHTIVPENSHLFAAIGSALNYKDNSVTTLSSLIDRLSNGIKMEFEVARMEPLLRIRLITMNLQRVTATIM